MKEATINIKGVDVTLFKSQRAKNISITIKPFVGVRVSVPSSISFKSAEKVVLGRMAWIVKNQSKIQQAERKLTVFTSDSDFRTRNHKLEIINSDVADIRLIVRAGKIMVLIPNDEMVSSAEVQRLIRAAIERAWRIEAKDFLPGRVENLAAAHGFKYKKVSVKNSKTRWGSCSAENNINLSLHLMRLPDHLIDYVILHELVHTKVKNHSKDFWQMLDQVSGNAKGLDREVKKFKIKIY